MGNEKVDKLGKVDGCIGNDQQSTLWDEGQKLEFPINQNSFQTSKDNGPLLVSPVCMKIKDQGQKSQDVIFLEVLSITYRASQ